MCYLLSLLVSLISLSKINPYCPDFRYESNGIFVLGAGFFFQTNFDYFSRKILISFKRYCCSELKFEKIFHP